MRNEHCNSADSAKEFTVSNYGTLTKHLYEYWFLAEPTDEKRAERGLSEWPQEQDSLVASAGRRKQTELK